ncbi:MAG: hypothetical protein GF317_19485 [Candidatus Lokiarchaeota archaeon]|nr:hypothetical protein [Candidatus Lokiarchaeota archaeon]MBD3201679.1 hypothetical protein [Candidatus Lokiarchaeota archaeon]
MPEIIMITNQKILVSLIKLNAKLKNISEESMIEINKKQDLKYFNTFAIDIS